MQAHGSFKISSALGVTAARSDHFGALLRAPASIGSLASAAFGSSSPRVPSLQMLCPIVSRYYCKPALGYAGAAARRVPYFWIYSAFLPCSQAYPRRRRRRSLQTRPTPLYRKRLPRACSALFCRDRALPPCMLKFAAGSAAAASVSMRQ